MNVPYEEGWNMVLTKIGHALRPEVTSANQRCGNQHDIDIVAMKHSIDIAAI